ncbi:MAG: protocatechuate 3,4-dioxygenase beta subunit, partial [Pseudohongiellaceae bacterium]
VGAGVTGATIVSLKIKVLTGVTVTLATLAGMIWMLEPSAPETVAQQNGNTEAVVVAPLASAVNAPNGLLSEPAAQASPLIPEVVPAIAQAAPRPTTDSVLRGVVLDGDGLPLQGAEVRFAWHADDTNSLLGVVYDDSLAPVTFRPSTEGVFTDKDGSFALPEQLGRATVDGLSGTLLVLLHEQHVTRIHSNPPLKPGDSDLGKISMAFAGSLAGHITDPAGRPLHGVTIELATWAPDSVQDIHSGSPLDPYRLDRATRTVVRTVTEKNGHFLLTGLPSGTVDVTITRSDLGVLPITGKSITVGQIHDMGTLMLGTGGQIGGQVLNPDGIPIVQAAVYAQHNSPPEIIERHSRADALVHTDGDGRFLIGGLLSGSYTVSSKASGTAFTHKPAVETGATSLTLTLHTPGEILFQLRDRITGEVIPEANVWANLPEHYDELTRHIRSQLFVLRGKQAQLPPGHYRISGAGTEGTVIRVLAKGYHQTEVFAEGVPSQGSASLEILLDRSLVFSGVVIDDQGEPISGTSVQIAPKSGPALNTGTVGAWTKEDGRFRIDAAPGNWTLWINDDGHRGVDSTLVSLPLPDDGPFVIQLLKNHNVEGTVTDSAGLPVTSASVMAMTEPLPEQPKLGRWNGQPISITSTVRKTTQLTTTDEFGHYQFLALTPGRQVLLAIAAPMTPEALPTLETLDAHMPPNAVDLWLSSEDLNPVDLALVEGAVVRGTVTSAGVPLAGATVQVVSTPNTEQRWQVVASGITDERGEYQFTGLLPGPAVLVANAPSSLVDVQSITLVDGSTQVIHSDLRGASLLCRVVDGRTGEAIANANVQVMPHREPGNSFPSLGGFDQAFLGRLRNEALRYLWVEQSTNSKGEVFAQHLPTGRTTLFVKASGYLRPDSVTVQLSDDEQTHDVTVKLQQAAIIRGTLVTERGRHADDYLIELHDRSTFTVVDTVWPNEGLWAFDPVDVGIYELRVFSRDDRKTKVASETVTIARGDLREVDFVID